MSALLPLLSLAVAAIPLVAMPWHRPHPNHLLFRELLPHVEDESELSGHSADGSKSGDLRARLAKPVDQRWLLRK